MANLFARATANWSSANWNTQADGGGTPTTPGAGDVCMANSFTVTIDADVTVAEIRNGTTGGATAGGGFVLNDGVTLTATCINGNATALVTYAGTTSATIVGAVTGSTGFGVAKTGTGTLTITGNVTTGASVGVRGIDMTAGHTQITGNVTGGVGSQSYGVYVRNAATATINGTVTGGTDVLAAGIGHIGTGIVTVNGSLVLGTAPATSTSSTGYILLNGDATLSSSGAPCWSGALRFGTNARILARDSAATQIAMKLPDYPAEADVKRGTAFDYSAKTGTLTATGNVSMAGHMT